MAFQRKSSRGNPWHDERGRFCSGPPDDVEIVGDYDGGIVIGGYGAQELCESLGIMPSMRDESGYYDEEPDDRTYDERSPGGVFPEVEIQLNDDNSGEVFVEYHGRSYSEFLFNGDGEALRHRLNPTRSERTPEEYEQQTAKRMRDNEDAIKERGKEPQKKTMPWDTDRRFKGQKNAKLLWLMEHPEHKYNDSELLWKIKAIQEASDRGVGKVEREKMFANMLKTHDLDREEGIELVGEEFLK